MSYQSVNPYDGTIVQTFSTCSATELEERIAIANLCFKQWRSESFAYRAQVATTAAALLRGRVDHFARIITLEMGKRIAEARAEVKLSAEIIDYYAKNAEAFLVAVQLTPKSGEADVESSPLGVLFGVQPWNFPYYQLARFAAPNLMAGNVVMVKHAASVPQCAEAFAELWIEAGAPRGAYTNLRISHDQVNQVIDDRRIKGVALTGSVEAGRSVAARAGQNLKKATLELGGSDAFIVLDDADVAGTVKLAMQARMANTGQSCVAAKRFIVVEPIADAFVEQFATAMAALEAGDPMNEATTLGPMSSEAALAKLLEQVDVALSHGATAVVGGKRLQRRGAFMEATILTDVSRENPAFREEFFGPVAMVFRVDDEDAAVALANDSDFGLGGSIFTQDVVRGRRLASRIESGMVFINQPTGSTPDLPFGGIKDSGFGRELGSQGIQEFVNKKLICVAPPQARAAHVAVG